MDGRLLPGRIGSVRPDEASLDQGRRGLWAVLIGMAALLVGALAASAPPAFVIGAILIPMAIAAILKWPYVGLLLYMVIYFTQIADQFPALKPLRPERVVGVMTLLALFLKQLREEGRLYIDRSKLTVALFLIVVAVLNSIPLAWWPGKSFNGLVELLKIVIFYILVVQLARDQKRFRVFIFLYVACMVYIASDGIVNYMAGNVKYAPDGTVRLRGSTDVSGASNTMAATMAICFPIFMALFRAKALKAWRWLFVFASILTITVLVLTGSRSGMIGFAAGAFLVWWSSPRRLLLLAVMVPLLGIGWTLMPAEHQARYATLSDATHQGTARSRMQLWHKGVLMFFDHPFTGVGMYCYTAANPTYSEETGLDLEPWHDSHSLYVQVASELGIPGLIAVGMYISQLVLTLQRTRRKMGDDPDWEIESLFLHGMWMAVMALLVSGIMGHNLMRRQWYIFGAMAVAATRVYYESTKIVTGAAVAKLRG